MLAKVPSLREIVQNISSQLLYTQNREFTTVYRVTRSYCYRQRASILRQHLERLRTQDVGVASLVQVLVEYARSLEQACRAETAARVRLARDLQATGQSDQRQVEELQAALAGTTERYQAQLAQQKAETARQAALYAETQTKLQDVQKELSSMKLEMTMHGSQQRNKLATATQHKKILKKEVLDLRQKLDQAVSELKHVRHEADSRQLFAAQEQQKSQLLERYVEKMESQVKVQQNMMELMSTSGSVYGAEVKFFMIQRTTPSVYNNGVSIAAAKEEHDDDDNDMDDDDDDDEEHLDNSRQIDVIGGPLGRKTPTSAKARRRSSPAVDSNYLNHLLDDAMMEDNKSHISELTEDRTQRHFELISREYGLPLDNRGGTSPRMTRRASPRQPKGPPSYIIGVNNNNRHSSSIANDRRHQSPHDDDLGQQQQQKVEERYAGRNLDTIHSSANSLPPTSTAMTPVLSRRKGFPCGNSSSSSLSGTRSRKKLSVAQRARLEAERGKMTPVRAQARLDAPSKINVVVPKMEEERTEPMTDSGGWLWRRMEEAVLGPRSDDDDGTMTSSEAYGETLRSTRVTDYTEDSAAREEKKQGDSESVSVCVKIAS